MNRAEKQEGRTIEQDNLATGKMHDHPRTKSLNILVNMASELLACPDQETLLRRAVELARERLEAERCSLYLYDSGTDSLMATFGTDMSGQTIDERRFSIVHSQYWKDAIERARSSERYWVEMETTYSYWNGSETVFGEKGWVCCTPLLSGAELVDFFFNDAAMTQEPVSPQRQDMLAVYVSLLGSILARRQAEGRFQTLLHGLDGVVWEADVKTMAFTYVSPQAEALLGYPAAQWLDPTFWQKQLHPDDREEAIRFCTTETQARRDHRFEYRMIAADGRVVWINDIVSVVVENDQPVRLYGFLEDITLRKQEEENRRRIEKERDLLLNRLHLQRERMPLAYLLTDAEFCLVDWNPAAERLFGYTRAETLERHPFDLIVPPDERFQREAFEHRMRRGDMDSHGVYQNINREGHTLFCDWKNTPLFENDGTFVGLLAMAQDVTDRTRMEEHLQQAQRMESIGRLAGGVAHDFNNLLTAILGYSQLAEEEVEPHTTVSSYLANITRAAERAALLTQQLLAFARKQIIEPKAVNVNHLIQEISSLLHRLSGEHIALTIRLNLDLWPAQADPGQFEQVLINLTVNARDAMPEGGELIVETANVTLDENYARQYTEVASGDYVMVAFSDNGMGMTEEVRAHIFEPFYTTKEKGKGTGLGLATCYGIIKQIGGHIWVYSEAGTGTTFKVYLPRVAEPPVSGTAREPAVRMPSGSETILLVEDEELVRRITAQILRERGYTVLEAARGHEAVRIAEETLNTIDLLVTDVIMPEMGGKEVAARIQALRPGLKTLYTSGYTDNAIVQHGLLEEGIAFLAKPFTPTTLARKVREVLDQSDE